MTGRAPKQAFRLGSCLVIPDRNRIEREGRFVQVEPRVMDVLAALAEHAGTVVSRGDLVDRVWGNDRGSDETLSRSISLLRRAFGELGAEPMITTIPKRGYRLAAPVGEVQPEPPGGAAGRTQSAEAPATRARKTYRTAALPVMGLVVAFLLVGVLRPWSTGKEPVAEAKAQQADRMRSLAVLPFVPFTDDRNDIHFSHGLTEELINSLVGIPDLGVAARTSSFRYRDARDDVRDIGRRLGVDYVVEGSVRRDGERLRVTTQLVRTSDGLHVWSGVEEEAEGGSSFAMQDEIAREVRRALELHLGVGSGGDVQPSSIVSAEAASLYFKGLHDVADGLREDGAAKAGYDALRAAVKLEPDFPEAWVALAETGVLWADGPFANDHERFIAQLRHDLDMALAKAPENHRAHIAAARFHGTIDLDIDRAARHLEKAESLAPKAATVLYARGWFSWLTGDVDRAFENYRQGLALDPLNEQALFSFAAKRAMLGETDEAFSYMRECQKTDCLQEGFVAYATAVVLMRGDEREKAWWAPVYKGFERRIEKLPASAKPDATKVMPAYAALHFQDPDTASKVTAVRELFARSPITNHIGMWGPTLADVLDRDNFMDALVRAYEEGNVFSHGLAMSPFYGANHWPDWVLVHPRYRQLWDRPELARLAEMRRENGWEDGLPPGL